MSHIGSFRPVLRPRARFTAGAMVVSALIVVMVLMILSYFSRLY